MLNPMHLLTSIKPPAINPVNEVRPVGPLQGDPRQGFSGLLQQASQQHANQPPARPAAPRSAAQSNPPRPQATPAPKPAAVNPPSAQAQRSAPAEQPRAARQDTPASQAAADTKRGGVREAAGSAAESAAVPADVAARRDDSAPAARNERSALDAIWDVLGHGQVDPQAQAEDLATLSGSLAESLGEAEETGIDAGELANMDGTLLPGVDTLAWTNPSPMQTDPAAASSLASSLAALADGRTEPGTAQLADAAAGADGAALGDLAAMTGAEPGEAAGQGSIELTEDTARATHETFQQALVEGQLQGEDAATGPALRQAGMATPSAAAEPASAGPGATHTVHGAPLSAASPTGAASATNPAGGMPPAGYALGTPVDSPDFPQAMATQISYFVREGIQQAQLHLNPAEMGPVSVQIALNGQQAQVDFAAASSATRAAIENSLSDLAASLQSAGFTLTGGGVSQQSQQSSQQGSGQAGADARLDRGNGQGDTPEAAATTPVLHHRHGAGGLDLYA